MTTVAVSPSNVAGFSEGGGHFWVYMQYVLGLRRLGCEVLWVERRPQHASREVLALFFRRMRRYGLGGRAFLYGGEGELPVAVARRADLLLNFDHRIDAAVLRRFRRTALVDIDPGLLQFWIACGQLRVAAHDHYFTIGETVGTPHAGFPDCGLRWTYVPPPVSLEAWPYAYDARCERFTTVSSWWGGSGKGEWVTDGHSLFFENNKRVSFLEFLELPRLTSQPLELALFLGNGDPARRPERDSWRARAPVPPGLTDYVSDERDRELLERHGWRVRHSAEVAGSPERYAAYIRSSRGEFSAAKPSCIRFGNAWVSDRTLCYLASGKPVVVQHTGPSSVLPDGEGMFRVSSAEQAAEALAQINSDYDRHCRAARDIAETYFDSERVLRQILEGSLT